MKIEEFIGNIETNFNQAEKRVQEIFLQEWDMSEDILVSSYTPLLMAIVVRKIPLEMVIRSMVKTNALQQEKQEWSYNKVQEADVEGQEHEQNYIWDPRRCNNKMHG